VRKSRGLLESKNLPFKHSKLQDICILIMAKLAVIFLFGVLEKCLKKKQLALL